MIIPADTCITKEVTILMGTALKARKFSEVMADKRLTRFQKQIANRVFRCANNNRIYCPEVSLIGDILQMKWDNDDKYILVTITNNKKLISYAAGDRFSSTTYKTNLNCSNIEEMFCGLSLLFYG